MNLFRMTPDRLALALGGLALFLILVVFGIGWFNSIQIGDGAFRVKHDPAKYQVEFSSWL